MKVYGFDGREYNLGYIKNKYRKGRSNLHSQCRKLLHNIFSQYPIYEEVTLPGANKGNKTSPLMADFFIPELLLIVEVHGEQHYKYTPYFHGAIHEGGKMNFTLSKIRDQDKIDWCHLNNIDIAILPYNESEEQWKKTLTMIRSLD